MKSTFSARRQRVRTRPQTRGFASAIAIVFTLFVASFLRADDEPPQQVPAASQAKISAAGIGNFGQVDARLFRGAQPELSAFAGLKALGFTTIVRLNGEGADVGAEKKQVETLGMHFVNLPWSGAGRPTHEQVVTFLALLHDDPSAKVFVHCLHGADRTGVMVALYRLEFSHWTVVQAMAEMKQFHYHHFFLPHLQTYVESFPSSLKNDAELAKLQAPVVAVAPAVAAIVP